MGKEVLFTLPHQDKNSKFVLSAYIYRIDPKNPKERLRQLELLDKTCNHCIVIADMKNVQIQE